MEQIHPYEDVPAFHLSLGCASPHLAIQIEYGVEPCDPTIRHGRSLGGFDLSNDATRLGGADVSQRLHGKKQVPGIAFHRGLFEKRNRTTRSNDSEAPQGRPPHALVRVCDQCAEIGARTFVVRTCEICEPIYDSGTSQLRHGRDHSVHGGVDHR